MQSVFGFGSWDFDFSLFVGDFDALVDRSHVSVLFVLGDGSAL